MAGQSKASQVVNRKRRKLYNRTSFVEPIDREQLIY